jgi:BirA family transcriptional regulator, biotin operon repressor / biotin---[acetyl-CoA-carboxylase] ligase
MHFTILTYDVIDSTNAEALKHARLGSSEGTCIIAREQTAGRGRYGRTWVSEKNAGLYFSLLLRPSFPPERLSLITLMAGIAVHETLSGIGLDPDIKWVNDVLVSEKKISGILAETTETSLGLAVVLGIGINLKSTGFPPELAGIATSIEQEGGPPMTVESLAAALRPNISAFYKRLHEDNGAGQIVEEWQKRSTFAVGKTVRVITAAGELIGLTDGIEPNGALRLRTENGNIEIISTGDVQNVRSVE